MQSIAETANEPYTRPRAHDGKYLELHYRIRLDHADFGDERCLLISDIARVGRLDREQWLPPDIALPAADTRTSRHHGVLVLSREDGLRLIYHDLRSENGSYVGSERVTHCPVFAGLRLRLGQHEQRSELWCVALREVQPALEPIWPATGHGDLRGESAPLRHLFAALADLVARGETHPLLVLQGPGGSGKKAAMWQLLRQWHPLGPPGVHYVDCRWLALDAGPQPLLTQLRDGAQVIVLDHLYALSVRQQKDLGGVLQRIAADRRAAPAPRVIALLRTHELQRQHLEVRDSGLLKVLHAAPTLRLPSAAVCGPGEVVRFAEMFLRRYQEDAPTGNRFAVAACSLSPGASAVLAQESWPGNWGQLQTVVEAAALAVAMDGRRVIEAEDLQIGFSEVHLPLDRLYEQPLHAAEQMFRQAYILAAARRFAGNLSWMAPAMKFTKRGLLKTTQDIGMHDGDQMTLPPAPTWTLQDPRRVREDDRLRVTVPSALVWLQLVTHPDGPLAARARLLTLLNHHPAAVLEQALLDMLEHGHHCFDALERAMRMGRVRRRPRP